MEKLVDLLAKYLVEWPDGATHAVVDKDCDGQSKVCFTKGGAPEWRERMGYWTVCGGCQIEVEWLMNPEMDSHGLVAAPHQIVTQSEYLAARDRMHVETVKGMYVSGVLEAQEFDTDQALWDKVASLRYGKHMDDYYESGYSMDESRSLGAQLAFDDADAFMAERAKRLKKAQAHEN